MNEFIVSTGSGQRVISDDKTARRGRKTSRLGSRRGE